MSSKAADTHIETHHERTGEGRPPIMELAKETFKEFKDDEVTQMSAAVAYHTVFAIPPLLVFIISMAALLNKVTSLPIAERLTTFIDERAPAELEPVLTTIVNNAISQSSSGAAITGILFSAGIALWSGSNGIGSFVKAFNHAYDVEETRGFIKAKLINIGLTMLVGILVIAAIGLFAFGHYLGAWIAEQAGLGSAFEILWRILSWILPVFFIMFVLAILYYLGPNIEQSFKWLSPGSVVATLLWIVVTIGFTIYLNFSNPGSAYGTLGSVIVLLYFLYLTAIVFITGAEVNAVLQRRYDEATIEDLAAHPEKSANSDEYRTAVERADNMDQRDDTNVSNRVPKEERKGGGFAAGVWSLLLAFIIARFRRPSRHS